jgi:hypothetical protein
MSVPLRAHATWCKSHVSESDSGLSSAEFGQPTAHASRQSARISLVEPTGTTLGTHEQFEWVDYLLEDRHYEGSAMPDLLR